MSEFELKRREYCPTCHHRIEGEWIPIGTRFPTEKEVKENDGEFLTIHQGPNHRTFIRVQKYRPIFPGVEIRIWEFPFDLVGWQPVNNVIYGSL